MITGLVGPPVVGAGLLPGVFWMITGLAGPLSEAS